MHTVKGSSIPVVAKPIPFIDWRHLKRKWTHLSDLPLKQTGGQVDILLGSDYAHLLAVTECRLGKEFEPVASKTQLGWMVNGVIGTEDIQVKSVRIHHACFSRQEDYSTQPELLANQSRRSCSLPAAQTEDSSSPSKDTFWHNQFKQNVYLEEEPSYAKTETEAIYGASMTKPVLAEENFKSVGETTNSIVENETLQSATLPFIISQQVEGLFS